MANYYETARTNYFLVKDAEAFKKECSFIGDSEVVTQERDGKTYFGILGSQEYGFPVWLRDENEDEIEIDWEEFFKRHLADDEVAIVMGAGSEKIRYVNGWAVAYNNKGEAVSINLDDIYDKAKTLGSNITHASY
jgi:hypothetical protein